MSNCYLLRIALSRNTPRELFDRQSRKFLKHYFELTEERGVQAKGREKFPRFGSPGHCDGCFDSSQLKRELPLLTSRFPELRFLVYVFDQDMTHLHVYAVRDSNVRLVRSFDQSRTDIGDAGSFSISMNPRYVTIENEITPLFQQQKPSQNYNPGAGGHARPHSNHITTVVGRPFEIKLRENPSTGYSWELEPLPDYVTVVKSQYTPSSTDLAGAPGTHTWILKSSQAGKFTIIAVYRRSWEAENAQEERRTFRITVNPAE